MLPQEFSALRETQRRLGDQQDRFNEKLEELVGRQDRLDESLIEARKETLRVGRSLEENTATTKRSEDKIDAVKNDTADLVDAFKTAVKVYKAFDWLRRFLKDWAWLPAMVVTAYGTWKGWWSRLWS